MFDRILRKRRLTIIKPFSKDISPDGLRITLCDLNSEMCDAWAGEFDDAGDVEIVLGSVTDVDCDAVVSAANSYGDMSGGVDKHIDDFFEGRAQRLLIPEIRELYFGEMPVGTAMVLSMTGARIPFLVVAPTMRTPGPVVHTLNAYLAFRAALVAVIRGPEARGTPILRLAAPGLCTGIGRMPFAQSAEQMRAAYDNVVCEEWIDIAHPAQAPYPSTKKWNWEATSTGENAV